jgi:hypothetical protein
MRKWILLSCLISIQSEAASISTYRIYLDNDHRQEKFIVKNGSVIPEKCETSFSYLAYDESSSVKKLTTEEQEKLSAPSLKRLRYSPKKFILQPKSFQYIALNYSRQINDTPKEYRTYLNIKCIQIDDQVKQGITLKPAIMHAVPLVIRTGKSTDLDANLTFSQVKQQNDSIAFRLDHQGNRSVYGDLNLVDEEGKKLTVLQRNIVIYPEMRYKDFDFSLLGFDNKNLKIEFLETGAYSHKKRFELSLKGEM